MIPEGVVYGAAALAAGATVLPELLDKVRRVPGGKASRGLGGFASLLPYQSQPRHDVLKLKNGSFLAAWSYGAEDVSVLPDPHIDAVADTVAGALGLLPNSAIVQFYARRRPLVEFEQGLGLDQPVLGVIDKLRRLEQEREPLFATDRFVALTWRPPGTRQANPSYAAALIEEEGFLASFLSVVGRFQSSLGTDLNLRRLGSVKTKDAFGIRRQRSELLRFISSTIDGVDAPLNDPPQYTPLKGYLCSGDFHGGVSPMMGDQHILCLELRTYPESTEALILDRLVQLDVKLDFTTKYIALSGEEVRKRLGGGIKDTQGSATSHLGFRDPDADEASHDLVAAYGASHKDLTRFGLTSSVIVLRSSSKDALRKAQSEVLGVIEKAGFRASAGHFAHTEMFLSTLPGDAEHGIRKHPQGALTVSHVTPKHERDAGSPWNPSRVFSGLVPPLFYAAGPGNTFTRVHLNSGAAGDVWNGLILGPTGSSKSVLSMFMAASFRGRLPEGCASVSVIDSGLASYRMAKSLGGSVFDLLGPKSPGFALFPDIENDGERAWVLGLLTEMLELWGEPAGVKPHKYISEALLSLIDVPSEMRSMTAFIEQLQDPSGYLKAVFERYADESGTLGSLLNQSVDSFSASRFDVIDIARLMGEDPQWVIPVLRTVFHKIERAVESWRESLGKKAADHHHIFVIDEAHRLLGHPIGQRLIKDVLKMGRSERMGVWLITNGLTDFTESPILADILQGCAWRAFLRDAGARLPEKAPLYKKLELTESSIEAVASLKPFTFLLCRPDSGTTQVLDPKISADLLSIIGTSHKIEDTRVAEKRWVEQWRSRLASSEGCPVAASLLSEEGL